MPLSAALAPLPSQEAVLRQIDAILPIEHQPNVFLFVIESLRHDYITADNTPALYQFSMANTHANLSSSNANFTHLSWFSIFQSQLPFYWTSMQEAKWNHGALGLQVFRKLGYQTRVYSSAQLGFYEMEKLLFGPKLELVDSYRTFHHPAPKKAWQSDRQTMDALLADLKNPSLASGQLFIVFLDTPHFDYNHPKIGSFHPEASDIAFFKAYPTKQNIEKIQNRYRNAIYFVDRLFQEFLDQVPKEALIALSGDHGEEFFDHGHLFHGSHLSEEQITVPILFRIPNAQKQLEMVSQIDIFPTLIDAVSNQTFPFLAGESILRKRKAPFVATLRFNARHAPYEFALRTERHKLVAQLDKKWDIFHANHLRVLSLKTRAGKSLTHFADTPQAWIQTHFGFALKDLFSSKEVQSPP